MIRSRSFRPLPQTRQIVFAALAATPLLVTGLFAGNAQALQIDDFNGDNFNCSGNAGPNFCSVTPIEYSGAVGGWRAAFFSDGSTANSELRVLGGNFQHETGSDNVVSRIDWDGAGTALLADFTDGGASDRIRIVLEIDDLSPLDQSPVLTFVMGTAAGGSGVEMGNISFTVDASGTYDVPLDNDLWASEGGIDLDFTTVIFLRLLIAPMNSDFTVTIDNIATVPVPEPGTALLMGLGLAGLAAGGRSRRQTTGKRA